MEADAGYTLREAVAGQASLYQLFATSAADSFLTFTLSGLDLAGGASAPPDAFEFALLDASTGRRLLGGRALNGWSGSDAELNLQAAGGTLSQLAGAAVSSRLAPDGRRVYSVDLREVAAGTPVYLSFDLIGFGAAVGTVTVSDIRMLNDVELDSGPRGDGALRQRCIAADVDEHDSRSQRVDVGRPGRGVVRHRGQGIAKDARQESRNVVQAAPLLELGGAPSPARAQWKSDKSTENVTKCECRAALGARRDAAARVFHSEKFAPGHAAPAGLTQPAALTAVEESEA